MPNLRFPDHALVQQMVEHCVESGEPLMLAHDEGVYLCHDAIRDDAGRCACAYAAGCDPRSDPDWYDRAHALVGGDDFGERLNMLGATRLLECIRRGERLVIRFTRRTITLLTERVAPPSTTPEAASGRSNGSPTSARTQEGNSDMSTTKKKSTKKSKPIGERLKKEALKENADRLADGKQDHEVPTAKEIANTPNRPRATKGERKAKSEKAPKGAARKRVSALDAAAQVLESAKEPMTSGALIDLMAKRDLWKSPGGKSPAATLYAAIIREIKAKGKDARFKKTDRGLFIATGKKAD